VTVHDTKQREEAFFGRWAAGSVASEQGAEEQAVSNAVEWAWDRNPVYERKREWVEKGVMENKQSYAQSGSRRSLTSSSHTTLYAAPHTTAWMQEVGQRRKPEPRAVH
jgi:hypothetical protein